MIPVGINYHFRSFERIDFFVCFHCEQKCHFTPAGGAPVPGSMPFASAQKQASSPALKWSSRTGYPSFNWLIPVDCHCCHLFVHLHGGLDRVQIPYQDNVFHIWQSRVNAIHKSGDELPGSIKCLVTHHIILQPSASITMRLSLNVGIYFENIFKHLAYESWVFMSSLRSTSGQELFQTCTNLDLAVALEH